MSEEINAEPSVLELKPPTPHQQEGIVSMLEELLALAREGKVSSIAVACFGRAASGALISKTGKAADNTFEAFALSGLCTRLAVELHQIGGFGYE